MTVPQVVDARTGPARVRFDEAASSMLRTIKAIENHPTLTSAAQACIEKHYMALGTRSIQVDDNTDDRLTALSVKTGRTPGELVAIFLKSSTPVDAGHPPATGRPDVEPGQGEAQPPAPTDARVLIRMDADDSEDSVCTHPHTRNWAQTILTCHADPVWWLHAIGDPEDFAGACCDDHIPDGWVRPDTNPVADALALVGLPAPCGQCGERSEHEVCS